MNKTLVGVGWFSLMVVAIVLALKAHRMSRDTLEMGSPAREIETMARDISRLRIQAQADADAAYRAIDQINRTMDSWVAVRGRVVDQTGGPSYPCFISNRDTVVSVMPDGSFNLPVKQSTNKTVEVWITHPWFRLAPTNINVAGTQIVYATRLP